jgi:hypothetical protein
MAMRDASRFFKAFIYQIIEARELHSCFQMPWLPPQLIILVPKKTNHIRPYNHSRKVDLRIFVPGREHELFDNLGGSIVHREDVVLTEILGHVSH